MKSLRYIAIVTCFSVSTVVLAQNNQVPDIDEFNALKALWESTNGASWTNKTGWPTAGNWPSSATSAEMASWYGVTVQTGDVQVINLTNNNLTGSIPSQVNLLKKLRHLVVNVNSLTGIAQDLTGLSSLESLQASTNNIEGPLPNIKNNLNTLGNLAFGFNRFSGGIPLSYTTAGHLQYLTLNDNYLSGSLPPQLGNLSLLVRIFLQNNRFTGSVPVEFGGLVNLETLYIFNNQLSGELPSTMANMVKIIWFYVHQNNLSGAIPSIFSTMPALYGLSLRDNKFSGPLPPIRGSQIDVYNNLFTGDFPTMNSSVTLLNASNNKFSSLPSAISTYTALSVLNFQNNELASLPSSLVSHPNKANLQLLMQNNQLDFGVLESYVTGFKSNTILIPQKTVRDQSTQTLVLGSTFVLTARAPGSFTTLTWEKQNGSTWTAVTDDQDSAPQTYTRTTATESNEGVYRWRSTSTKFASQTIQSDPITVKTAPHFTVDNLTFQYKYDARKRMSHKRVPGADWVYMVYDNRDRLVLTQDGNQRATNLWVFTKYDEFNRPILTGVKDTTVVLTQEAMQTVVNQYYGRASARWFELQGTSVHGYTNKSYPVLADPFKYLSATYYDDYTWKNSLSNSARLDFKGDELPGEQASVALNKTNGLATGSKVKVLDGGIWGGTTWLATAVYYDDDRRAIQTVSDNYKAGTDRLTSIFEFTGRVLKAKTRHDNYDVNWRDRISVSITGNKVGSTQAVAGYGLSGTGSIQTLPASTDGWIEVTVTDPTGKGWVVGLSQSNPDAQETSTQFGIGVNTAGYVAVTKTSSHQATSVLAEKGDVLRIARTSGVIRFYRNGVEINTSENFGGALMVDAALYYSTSSFSNVRASFAMSDETVVKELEYDHVGRLEKIWHTYDNEKVLIVSNDYNELGQLIDRKLHSTDNGTTGKQSIDYRYDIRGWLKSINGSSLDPGFYNDDANGQARDLFGMDLFYFEGEVDLGNVGQFGGNISAIKWSNNLGMGSVKHNAYTYTYDAMNRLKGASFKQKTTEWQTNTTGAYNESGYSYDLNGNILSLTRKGKNGALMDNLAYDYGTGVNKSNRLLKVTDSYDKSTGFKDGTNLDNDYGYDFNGNMIVDQNKSVGTGGNVIRYNLLNLPEYVNRGGSSLHYAYDATGRKLSQTAVFIGSGSKKTDYAGDLVYENDDLSQVNTDEGRIVLSTPKLIYSNSGESVSSVVTLNASVAVTTMSGGEKYFDVTATGTVANSGLFPIADNIPVVAGERYLIKAKGYESNALVSYVQVKVNGTTVDALSAGLPNKDGSESWAEQVVTIKEDGELQAGVTWPTPVNGQKFYLNEFEVYKIEVTDPEYQYHLKDHLGNVRMTFTTKDEVDVVKATVEDQNETTEAGDFLNYDKLRKVNHTVFDHTFGHLAAPDGSAYAIRLNGSTNEKIGLAKSLSVMPGDKIKAEVYAKYYVPPSNPQGAFATLMAQIIAGTQPLGIVKDGLLYGSNSSTTVPGVLAGKSSETGTAPKAYLNWLVFDRDYNLILSKSNYKRISTAALENGSDVSHERLAPDLDIVVDEPGYIYIYLSNENQTPVEVYFDDFKVEQVKSLVVESSDYYPFGLTFNSYARENAVNQSNLYQGKELQDELGLEIYDFQARGYDPMLGRTWQTDPMSETFYDHSPYSWVKNNPLLRIDPTGMTDFTFNKKSGEVTQVGEANDEPDRILKTNKKGEVKYKKNGEAKVAMGGIEQGILADGQNWKTDDQVIGVGGEGQASVDGVKSFTMGLSEYLGKEIKGFSYSSNASGNVTDMVLGKYLNNSNTESYGTPNALRNKYGVDFSLNNITQEFHTHPDGKLGATQSSPNLSQDVTSLQNDKPFIPSASFIILYRAQGQQKPAEYDYTHEYRAPRKKKR